MYANVYNPFDLLNELIEETTSECPINKTSKYIVNGEYPKSNYYINTNDGTLHCEVAVAGFTEDEIDVKYKDNYITVFVNGKSNKPELKFIKKGISDRTGQVDFFVDSTKYDVSKTKVTLENGILSIVIPTSDKYVNNLTFGINGKKKIAKDSDKKGDSVTKQ